MTNKIKDIENEVKVTLEGVVENPGVITEWNHSHTLFDLKVKKASFPKKQEPFEIPIKMTLFYPEGLLLYRGDKARVDAQYIWSIANYFHEETSEPFVAQKIDILGGEVVKVTYLNNICMEDVEEKLKRASR